MLDICKQLFTKWNDYDVKYCHWKSNEHLMEGLDGETDLDVYVAPVDRQKAESLLNSCNYIECKVQEGHRYPNVVEWIGFDEKTGSLVHVHLHYQIITGTKYCKEYVFPLDDIIISSRIKDKTTGIYICNPNLEIIILFSRVSLKAKNPSNISPSQDDITEITYLQEKISKNAVYDYCVDFFDNKAEVFYSLIIKDTLNYKEWRIVHDIASGWLKPHRKYSKISVFFRYHYFQLRELLILVLNKKLGYCIINKKTFPGRNFAICFLGQDGCGKSTISIELCKWLNWKLDAKRFYLGSGDHYNGILKRIITRGAKLTSYKDNEEEILIKKKTAQPIRKRSKNIKTFISSFIVCWYNLNLARRAFRIMQKSESYRKKGGIPIFDRFPQMQFAGISDGPRIEHYYNENGLDFYTNRWMAKREMSYFEKIQKWQPKMVFKLLLPPEESIRRKPFEDLENVTKKHFITKELEFQESIVYTIDATQDYQTELLFLKTEIWKELLKKSV